jgi:hypothetical protein
VLFLRFILSEPFASVIIGCEQLAPLEQNVQAALNFTPISESGKQKVHGQNTVVAEEKSSPLFNFSFVTKPEHNRSALSACFRCGMRSTA